MLDSVDAAAQADNFGNDGWNTFIGESVEGEPFALRIEVAEALQRGFGAVQSARMDANGSRRAQW